MIDYIKGSSPKECDGIKFKSTLESTTYKTLLEEGIVPEYEKHTFIIWEGFTPTVPFYTKNDLKRKDRRYKVLSMRTLLSYRPLENVTYTPDFYFEYNGKKIIVEVKGFETLVFKIKFKMFRKYIEELPDKDSYIIWEIHNKKQLLECINFLKMCPSQ